MNKLQKYAAKKIAMSYDDLLKRFRTTRRAVIWERSIEMREDCERLDKEISRLRKKKDFWLRFLK
jgi:chromosome segregation ATPase